MLLAEPNCSTITHVVILLLGLGINKTYDGKCKNTFFLLLQEALRKNVSVHIAVQQSALSARCVPDHTPVLVILLCFSLVELHLE